MTMSDWQQTRYEFPAGADSAHENGGTSRSISKVPTDFSPRLVNSHGETAGGSAPLSIALIGPNEQRRSAAVMVLKNNGGSDVYEFSGYPPALDEAPKMLEENYDAVLVDLDSDPAFALELVESIGASGRATVMVYSSSTDPDLLVRCMQAGAREFLTYPFSPNVVTEALARAAARQPQAPVSARQAARQTGRLLAVMGAKGGAGATMLACNLAVALAQHKDQKTLLIDFDLPLGGVALNLGVTAQFSTVDALEAADRLDARFLSQLLVRHSSGVSLLVAPGRFVRYQIESSAIERLIRAARQEFDNVVLDLGSKVDLLGTVVYREATAFYLVTQASIPELRNSNRLIGEFFAGPLPRLEIVINRFEPRALGVSEDEINKALTKPAQWKIPNDYASVQKMQIHATPLVLEDSAITRQIKKMATAITGLEEEAPVKKKGFRLFS